MILLVVSRMTLFWSGGVQSRESLYSTRFLLIFLWLYYSSMANADENLKKHLQLAMRQLKVIADQRKPFVDKELGDLPIEVAVQTRRLERGGCRRNCRHSHLRDIFHHLLDFDKRLLLELQ